MPNYMLALYGPEVDDAAMAEQCDGPLWEEVTDSLRAAGLLVANDALHPVATATTVRVRDGEAELTDGPFAVTKETLAGYYILTCVDLNQALKHAALLPIARYGSVEVRPIVELAPSSLLDGEVAHE